MSAPIRRPSAPERGPEAPFELVDIFGTQAKGWLKPGSPSLTLPIAADDQTWPAKNGAVGAKRRPTSAETFRRAGSVCYNDWRRAGTGYQERGVMELARAAAESGTTIAVAR